VDSWVCDLLNDCTHEGENSMRYALSMSAALVTLSALSIHPAMAQVHPETAQAQITRPAACEPSGIILFTPEGGRQWEIMSVDPANGEIQRLTNNRVPGHAPSDRSASATNAGRILYISDPERHGWMSLFMMDTDGGNRQRLTPVPPTRDQGSWDAAISPDGRFAAFTIGPDNRTSLRLIEIETVEVTPVQAQLNPTTPAWFHDGKRIAYVSNQVQKGELWVTDIDATGQEKLAGDAHPNARPAWSPDGNELIYVASQEKNLSIVQLNLLTRERRKLHSGVGEETRIAYSPDGRFIVFDGPSGNGRGSVLGAEGDPPHSHLPVIIEAPLSPFSGILCNQAPVHRPGYHHHDQGIESGFDFSDCLEQGDKYPSYQANCGAVGVTPGSVRAFTIWLTRT
jgi:hypothetical protein